MQTFDLTDLTLWKIIIQTEVIKLSIHISIFTVFQDVYSSAIITLNFLFPGICCWVPIWIPTRGDCQWTLTCTPTCAWCIITPRWRQWRNNTIPARSVHTAMTTPRWQELATTTNIMTTATWCAWVLEDEQATRYLITFLICQVTPIIAMTCKLWLRMPHLIKRISG